jgi:hypothetical protein
MNRVLTSRSSIKNPKSSVFSFYPIFNFFVDFFIGRRWNDTDFFAIQKQAIDNPPLLYCFWIDCFNFSNLYLVNKIF